MILLICSQTSINERSFVSSSKGVTPRSHCWSSVTILPETDMCESVESCRGRSLEAERCAEDKLFLLFKLSQISLKQRAEMKARSEAVHVAL